MGPHLSTVHKTAITKFVSSTPTPPNEIVNVIFNPLSQIQWRDIDFTTQEAKDTIESNLIAHTSETQNIQHLFSYVAKLLDGVSSAATSGSLMNGAKESQAQVQKATNLTRLSAVILFNVVQQCAGNPFVLLRLTNSENEAAMTLLGAAAELIVRVPFNALTAPLHVETCEFVRFSFSTRLFGPGLALAKDHALQLTSSFANLAMNNNNESSNKNETTSSTRNENSEENNSVRDPFLRRLALGQRDALLTKALVHALLQRIVIWSNVLRGKVRPSVWINHQRASNIAPAQDPHPSLISTDIQNAVSPQRGGPTTVNSASNNNNAGIGSKMYGWFFGGGNNNNNNAAGKNQQNSSSTNYSNAGVSSNSSSAEAIVGSASLHILLSLLFFERGSHAKKARNTAVDVIRQLRGIDISPSSSSSSTHHKNSNAPSSASSQAKTASQVAAAVASSGLSPILGGEWPTEIVEAIATLAPSHFEAIFLLYSLLIDCPTFSKSVTQSSNHGLHVQLAHISVDIIKVAVERPSSPDSLFAAVLISLLSRIDPVARCMFASERLRAVPEYFARESPFVTTSMYIGSFLILTIVKVVFRASMGDGQAVIGASWLSALVNLSPFVMNLETAVEQKLSSLFLALIRRTNRLKAEVKASETAFASAAQLDTALSHLDILGTAMFQMIADPQRNPTLIYELLYHREKISNVTLDWIEGDAVWRALKPVTFILDKIETELSSSGNQQRSIPAILDIIRNLGRDRSGLPRLSTNATDSSSNNNNNNNNLRVRIQVGKHKNKSGERQNNENGNTNECSSSSSSSSDDDEEQQESSEARYFKIRYPRITVIGVDEEVTLTSYDFEEDQLLGGGTSMSNSNYQDDDEDNNNNNSAAALVAESFFATMLWYFILQSEWKIQPPGCLRHGALGISHNEAYPIFRSA